MRCRFFTYKYQPFINKYHKLEPRPMARVHKNLFDLFLYLNLSIPKTWSEHSIPVLLKRWSCVSHIIKIQSGHTKQGFWFWACGIELLKSSKMLSVKMQRFPLILIILRTGVRFILFVWWVSGVGEGAGK